MIKSKKEILIFKNKYKYGEEILGIEDIKSEVIKSRNSKFLILDEEIYIKEYNKTKITDIKILIENEIKQEFSSDDYLIHFSVDYKNKKTLIYGKYRFRDLISRHWHNDGERLVPRFCQNLSGTSRFTAYLSRLERSA